MQSFVTNIERKLMKLLGGISEKRYIKCFKILIQFLYGYFLCEENRNILKKFDERIFLKESQDKFYKNVVFDFQSNAHRQPDIIKRFSDCNSRHFAFLSFVFTSVG